MIATVTTATALRTASAAPMPDRGVTAAEEDSGWLTAVATGDAEALHQLWSRYRVPCLRVADRVLGGASFSEDVVQQVFLDVWRQAGRFDPTRATAGSWILAMTHHKAVDRVRYEQRRSALSLDLPHLPASTAEATADIALDVVRRQVVRRALAALGARQREVLLLAYFADRTYAEIASLLDLPLGTVKTRGRAGMRNLRRFIDLEDVA